MRSKVHIWLKVFRQILIFFHFLTILTNFSLLHFDINSLWTDMHDFLCMQYGLHLMHFRDLACMNLFNQFQKGGKQDFLIKKRKEKKQKKHCNSPTQTDLYDTLSRRFQIIYGLWWSRSPRYMYASHNALQDL